MRPAIYAGRRWQGGRGNHRRVHRRRKGMIVLLSAAAITGVVLELERHERQKEASPPAPNGSASAANVAAPRKASRGEIEAAISKLERFVRSGASDERSPWALAHGLLAFGAELRTNDGRPAIDVIGSFAENRDGRYLFPERKQGGLVEPHPHLLVKTLLELKVPLDRELTAADGTKLPLARLVRDVGADVPQTEADWRRAAWRLSALALVDPKQTFAKAALDRLEAEQRAMDALPLRTAKQRKLGLFAHACGGLHFVQAVVSAVAAEGDPTAIRRLRKQLGRLAIRYETERELILNLLAEHPEQGLLLRVQQLKLFGHLIETLMLARNAGAYRIDSDGGRMLDGVALRAAADVSDVVGELDRGGVYSRLAQIRAEREQTYLDLVGDGCHAIRGLRQLLELFST